MEYQIHQQQTPTNLSTLFPLLVILSAFLPFLTLAGNSQSKLYIFFLYYSNNFIHNGKKKKIFLFTLLFHDLFSGVINLRVVLELWCFWIFDAKKFDHFCCTVLEKCCSRGLGAVRDLKRGEIILRVPKSALMTSESVIMEDKKLCLAVNRHSSLSSVQVFLLNL